MINRFLPRLRLSFAKGIDGAHRKEVKATMSGLQFTMHEYSLISASAGSRLFPFSIAFSQF